MKKVVATILSLSVLVAGSALATPPPVPSAPPVAAAVVSPQAAAVSSTAASTQALRAPSAQHPHRGHGHRFDRAGHRHGPGMAQHGRQFQHRGGRGERSHQRLRLGAPLAADRQGVVVTEHRRHGLNKAPRGQEWRRIGDRYVRVTSATNVVNEIVINGL